MITGNTPPCPTVALSVATCSDRKRKACFAIAVKHKCSFCVVWWSDNFLTFSRCFSVSMNCAKGGVSRVNKTFEFGLNDD